MFGKILVPLDNSPLAEQALPTAESLARAFGAAVELVYVHEQHPSGGYPDAPWNAARRTLEESYVRGVADEVRNGADIAVGSEIVAGSPSDAICDKAAECGADIIVMTTHGRTGISRAWLGSVADSVVRQSSVPVLLLRPEYHPGGGRPTRPPFRRVLVPLDGSLHGTAILQAAAALAKVDDGTLIVVEIVPPVPLPMVDATLSFAAQPTVVDAAATAEVVRLGEERLKKLAKGLADAGVTSIETSVIVSEFPAQAIINATHACSADAVAMTTGGEGASRLLIGSIADKVMRASFLPLLLFRPGARADANSSQEAVRLDFQPEHV